MIDTDTLDLVYGIQGLDILMDEFLEDSLNVTKLAQDDVDQDLYTSFKVEEEGDAITEASLHDSFATDMDSFLVESALDQQSEMNKGQWPGNDSRARDLETSRKNLNECMRQTAGTRSWLTKNVPSFGRKKKLKNKINRMNIKRGKTRNSIQVKAKWGLSTHGVSTFLHKKLLDRHHFTSNLLLSRNSNS
jgi:hypothetical protein